MANLVIFNDKVWTSPPLTFVTNGVSSTTPPAGSNPAVTSGLPNSLGAVMVVQNPALGVAYRIQLTPLVLASTSIPVTISGIGITSITYFFDIVTDPNPKPVPALDQVIADWVSTSQIVPTAPGP